MQAVSDNKGNIIWYSGVHLGTKSDIRIFRDNPPPLGPGERLLGDKAYIGEPDRLIAPVKKRRGQELNVRDRAYNLVHGWYRSTVEHCFAYLKRSVPVP